MRADLMTTFKERYNKDAKPPDSHDSTSLVNWYRILPDVLKNLAKQGVLKYSPGYDEAIAREFAEWRARQ